jgi:cbb3-type cytochrome oxidase subunit 3
MLDLNKLNPSTQIPQPLLKQLDNNEQFIDYRNITNNTYSTDSYRDREGNEIIFKGVKKFENYPLNLKLPYNKNHLTFHFAAIDWKAQHKIHYSHRVLGLNDNWSVPSKEAKTDYRNLPYGTYTFQIKAIGDSGEWSAPFEYTFTINPPWWLTWWAWLVYALLLFFILYWVYSFLLRRKLELAEVNRLQELDLFKTRLYTNLTHEFRTPMTVISGIADHILTQPSLENLEHGLPMIKWNSAQLLRLINQMLDLSKLESGSLSAKMIHDDILVYLKYLTESFHSFADSKDIRRTALLHHIPYYTTLAGAIAVTGMLPEGDEPSRFERILATFSRYAGRELDWDRDIYASESATGFRNRAIANLLRSFEVIGDPVTDIVEDYFRQCSILVTCNDLAIMAATLANGGVNPVTGERVLGEAHVEKVLSVMSTCGMYDYSGTWVYEVGLPAKSGVGGGVIGVLPGQFGLALYPPPLDAKGNSVRGVAGFRDLSRVFDLHLLRNRRCRRMRLGAPTGSPKSPPRGAGRTPTTSCSVISAARCS